MPPGVGFLARLLGLPLPGLHGNGLLRVHSPSSILFLDEGQLQLVLLQLAFVGLLDHLHLLLQFHFLLHQGRN